MFFLISKIIEYFLSPIIWIVGLLIWAFFTRDPRKSRTIIAIALSICLLLSNNFWVEEIVRLWEKPMISRTKIEQPYDAGIVLGGGMIQNDKSNDRLIFRTNTDRILQALELYKYGKIKKLIISGGTGMVTNREMKEGVLLKTYLLRIGIPDSAILVDSLSDNTHQNALYTKPILQKYCPNGRYLLITSSIHMRRALACFENQGIHCVPYPTGKMAGPRKFDFTDLFIPDFNSLQNFDMLFHEILGYLIYKMMGYV